MKKIPTPFLEDILKSIALISEYLSEIKYDKQRFLEDFEKQDSVIRRIEVIGEATKRLESDFRDQFPNIPWRNMAGMRDVLIHEYDQVDLELVWKTVTEDLPLLQQELSKILEA
jgi:uncharacterized protein with HEPN domain